MTTGPVAADERPNGVVAAAPVACRQCPWRRSNIGRRHPDGWYTKANRFRLWAQLRKGEAMTCHATDQCNPVPEGQAPVAEHVQTKECAGAWILQQREVWVFDNLARRAPDGANTLREYRQLRGGRSMTTAGLFAVVSRVMLGGTPLGSGPEMDRLDLGDPDIGLDKDGTLLPFPPPGMKQP